MAVIYTPHFAQFFDANGAPLAGGKLYTYAAGTTTPKATYTTAAGDVANTNPIILDSAGRAVLFLDGSYKFTLTDSTDSVIKTTDNITNFTTTGATADAYFETFSGDGVTAAFTTSESLGTDEKLLMVFSQREYSTNGTFATDTGWTKGAGWTIGSGVATATGAISTALEQTAALTVLQGRAYLVRMTITRSAGSITPNVGGTAGTARSASGTYSEIIIAGATQVISFTTSGFTGTVDNVSVTLVGENPNFRTDEYTINGTTLTFSSIPTSGTNNILVWAPSRLAGAASASAAAAATSEANAATSAANAATSETNAALSAAKLSGTSATSIAIGTGSKAFSTQSGKMFDVGVWLLIASDADETNYMHGQVTAYTGTSLTVNVTNTGGSGTFADWNITVSGTRGATGPAGSISGATTIDAATSAGITLRTNGLSDILLLGAGGAANGTFYGNLSMNTANKVVNMADPSSAQDAATKAYVDSRTPAASTSAAGVVELATVAEAEAGTDTTRAVTPEGVAAAIAISPQRLTLISTTALSGTTTNIAIPSGYSKYEVFVRGFTSSINARNMRIRVSDDNASTFESTGYYVSHNSIGTGTLTGTTAGLDLTDGQIAITTAASDSIDARLEWARIGTSNGNQQIFRGDAIQVDAGDWFTFSAFASTQAVGTNITHIQFSLSGTGNIGGTVELWGYAQ